MMMACSAAPLSPANGALNLDLAGGGGGGEGRVRRDGDSRRSPRSRKVITMKMTIDSGEFVPERRESVGKARNANNMVHYLRAISRL